MKKKANWYDDLFIYLEENKDKPFKWGSWDCCRFSNGAIKAMTGKTMIPNEVKWTSKVSALKAISKYGGSLIKSIDKACKNKGLQEIKPAYITAGDLVVYDGSDINVGICDGMNIVCVTDDGYTVLPNEKAIKVWRIDG
jgi:hypothetical protein